MKHALIIGGSGQDGPFLAQHLSDLGWVVHCTSRTDLASNSQRSPCSFHKLDVRDQAQMERLLDDLNPDLIYFLAAQSSVGASFVHPVDTWDVSAFGLVKMISSLQKLQAKPQVIFAASGECFGPSTRLDPSTETSSFNPHSPYAAAKCAGHVTVQAARKSGMHISSAFLFSHESPMRSENFVIGKVVSAAKRIKSGSQERLQLGNLNIVRDWGFAGEYMNCMARMSDLEEPEDFVIATGKSIRLGELVSDIFSAVGCDWREHVDVASIPARPADISEQHALPAKAKRVLGWEAGLAGRELAEALVANDPRSSA